MTASEPEGVKVTTEDATDGILEGHPGIYQCTSCGLFDQAEVQCGEHSHAPKPSDELAYNRWAEVESAGIAAHTVPLEDDRVLMLHPAEPPAFHTPITFTCGAKQVQTCLEPTTFDPQGRTLISNHGQGPPGERRLRPIVYGSKKLTTTQAKYGAPKLEMFAAYYFIVKNHSYLCPRKFTLRVDNQALSWLKTYSTDQALIGRWIMTLEKYHFRVEHRPRTQHRNADGLSKRTNEYRCREKQLAQQPAAGERWNFLSADEFDKLPVAPWFDLQGRVIPNHPELPAHLQNLEPKAPNQLLRVLRRTKRASRRDRQAKAFAAPLPPPPSLALQPHEDAYPDYPEDWIDVTDEAREDYLLPTHAVNVSSRTVYAIAGANPVALQGTPSGVRDSIMALKDINTELHEHAHTVHGIKDLILAQNRDVHVLALKKLVLNEPIDHDVFPENVREFARNYYRQKKTLLFINKNGVLCVRYPPNQRPLHERPCMIVMPQLYQHEILFRAHDTMGHQGISKVVARIQERHTWPGIRRSVSRYVGQCLTCQQVRDKPGDVRFHLKNIQSGYFNELVQYDHLKICPSDSKNTGILVIIDHFSKFAEAVPCSHHDYDAVTTSRLLLQKWFARHGTPTRMQSDNAPNLTAEVSNEFLKAAHVTKVTSTASHPRTQGLVERQNRTLLTLLRVFCSRRMRDCAACAHRLHRCPPPKKKHRYQEPQHPC